MAYYNVKITDLLPVEKLSPNHLFLIANPLEEDISDDTPYTSNKISGKDLSATLADVIEYEFCNVRPLIINTNWTVNGEFKFNGKMGDHSLDHYTESDHTAKQNMQIESSNFINALKDHNKLTSIINSGNVGVGWYGSRPETVLQGNDSDRQKERTGYEYSIGTDEQLGLKNSTVTNIDFVERTVAGAYEILDNRLNEIDVQINSFKNTIIDTKQNFARYAIIRFGNHKDFYYTDAQMSSKTEAELKDIDPIRNHVGVFNTPMTNKIPGYSSMSDKDKESWNIKSIFWQASDNKTMARTCIRLNNWYEIFNDDKLTLGGVASDGTFFYYKVSQDCTFFLKIRDDFSNFSDEVVQAFLLYNTNDVIKNNTAANRNKVKVIPLARMVESYVRSGSQQISSFPVRKGAIIMIAIYMREILPIPVTGDLADSSIKSHIKLKHAYHPQVFIQAPYTPSYDIAKELTAIINASDTVSATYDIGYHDDIYLNTYRLNADASNFSKLFKYKASNNFAWVTEQINKASDATKQTAICGKMKRSYKGHNFANIASIIEFTHDDA